MTYRHLRLFGEYRTILRSNIQYYYHTVAHPSHIVVVKSNDLQDPKEIQIASCHVIISLSFVLYSILFTMSLNKCRINF